MIQVLKAPDFKRFFELATERLKKAEQIINDLNVYPVPDGDTGTNMALTLQSVLEEVKKAPLELKDVGQAATHGALLGARGNSGVILSQIVRGLAEGLAGKSEATAEDLVEAFQRAEEVAYQAIKKPVEGTMLTVLRKAAQSVRKAKPKNMNELMGAILSASRHALRETPELLPVLKEAGVVDAGGYGLVVIFEALEEALTGEVSKEVEEELKALAKKAEIKEEELTYRYCTEFMVLDTDISQKDLEDKLTPFGDSLLVAFEKEGLYRVHIHTNQPDQVLALSLKFGEIADVRVNNMVEQMKKQFKEQRLEDKTSVVAVVAGEGFKKIFQSFGVEALVNGGQTLNPSSQEILEAIKKTRGKEVIVLPNNKNVILAAEQAKKIAKRVVYIVPTISMAEAVAALSSFIPEVKAEQNLVNMERSVNSVVSGEITQAVRDSELDGKKIKRGDFLGLIKGKIKVVGENFLEVVGETISQAVTPDSSFISLYLGEGVSEEDRKQLEDLLKLRFPRCEFDLVYGEQPVYPLIFSVE